MIFQYFRGFVDFLCFFYVQPCWLVECVSFWRNDLLLAVVYMRWFDFGVVSTCGSFGTTYRIALMAVALKTLPLGAYEDSLSVYVWTCFKWVYNYLIYTGYTYTIQSFSGVLHHRNKNTETHKLSHTPPTQTKAKPPTLWPPYHTLSSAKHRAASVTDSLFGPISVATVCTAPLGELFFCPPLLVQCSGGEIQPRYPSPVIIQANRWRRNSLKDETPPTQSNCRPKETQALLPKSRKCHLGYHFRQRCEFVCWASAEWKPPWRVTELLVCQVWWHLFV